MTVNVEALIIGALDGHEQIDGIPVVADVPKTRPERFVSVERTGGGREDVRDLPLVTLHAWDRTRYAASQTATVLADLLEGLAFTHPSVARVSIESTYNDPDPASGQARYRVTAQVVTHGA